MSRLTDLLDELYELEKDFGGFIVILKPDAAYHIVRCGTLDTNEAAVALAAFDAKEETSR